MSVNGVLSSLVKVLIATPHSSVLGALFFILFVNDMPEAVHGCIQIFVYDAKFYREMCSATDQRHLQAGLDALKGWPNEWLLRFNGDKCEVLHLASIIHLQENELEKDLGVYIDLLLNFSSHCEKQANKGNKILNLIRRSYSYLDETSPAKLYTSLVRRQLEYANSVSPPVYK